MSCYNCTKSFTLLNRERSCKKCGFAFCSNCLKQKLILPDPDGKMTEKSVCTSCYQRATQPKSSKMIRPPPDALMRRLESLESPNGTPITVYSHKMDRLKRGLSKEDAEIAERLQKLQSDRKISSGSGGLPSISEMAKRLAILKGEEPAKVDSSSVLMPQPVKSNVEQSSDLIQQLQDQVRLEQKMPKPEDEISERLARLRGLPPAEKTVSKETDPEEFLSQSSASASASIKNKFGDANTPIDILKLLEEVSKENESDASQAFDAFDKDEDLQKQLDEWRKKSKDARKESKEAKDEETPEDSDDEKEADKLATQIMEEAALDQDEAGDDLDERIPTPPSKNLLRQIQRAIRLSETESEGKDSDELPWCTICNEDAKLRCDGCEGDLYCNRCFRECHQEEVDLRDHKTSPYKAPAKKD